MGIGSSVSTIEIMIRGAIMRRLFESLSKTLKAIDDREQVRIRSVTQEVWYWVRAFLIVFLIVLVFSCAFVTVRLNFPLTFLLLLRCCILDFATSFLIVCAIWVVVYMGECARKPGKRKLQKKGKALMNGLLFLCMGLLLVLLRCFWMSPIYFEI